MSNSPNVYIPGDWNAICDVCGHKWKASKLRKRWDGAMCCPRDWEPRQPQDFVKGIPDNMAAPWQRPPTADIFVPSVAPLETNDQLFWITTEDGVSPILCTY